MQNAAVFLVEDNKDFADSLCELFPYRGHKVVLRASNLEEALSIINSNQLQENKVGVAVVDANFPEAEGKFEVLGGPVVAKAIKDAEPLIKVIANTAMAKRHVTYGDVYADKCKCPESLFEAIASL